MHLTVYQWHPHNDINPWLLHQFKQSLVMYNKKVYIYNILLKHSHKILYIYMSQNSLNDLNPDEEFVK